MLKIVFVAILLALFAAFMFAKQLEFVSRGELEVDFKITAIFAAIPALVLFAIGFLSLKVSWIASGVITMVLTILIILVYMCLRGVGIKAFIASFMLIFGGCIQTLAGTPFGPATKSLFGMIFLIVEIGLTVVLTIIALMIDWNQEKIEELDEEEEARTLAEDVSDADEADEESEGGDDDEEDDDEDDDEEDDSDKRRGQQTIYWFLLAAAGILVIVVCAWLGLQ